MGKQISLAGIYKHFICIAWLLIAYSVAHAQDSALVQARKYMNNTEYDKAIDIFENIYNTSSTDIYNEYLSALISAKRFKQAEKLIDNRESVQPSNPLLHIDMGHLYETAGKTKKAEEQYDNAIAMLNGDDMITQQMAGSFISIGKDQYALKVFERAKALLGGSPIYNVPIAKLYAKSGAIDKAVDVLIDSGPMQYSSTENTKGVMLEILGNDPQKLQLTQKALIKKINQRPDNTYYVEILTWLYIQKNDWDGALIQMEALEERGNTKGQRLIEFARAALREKQYDVAIKSYEEVKAKGSDLPFYIIASSEELNASLVKLEDNPSFKQEDVKKLTDDYDTFFVHFPQYYAQQTASDFAMVEAQYANDVEKSIRILQNVIKQPGITHDFSGRCALQLGDYYILTGKIWDASLLYSQVDKEFKQDALGEEARFRNAKLSFYVGDFDWAQGQLSVLKASTSELIANDALYLSVLITENTPADSNFVPLKRFAFADLLMFQNKDKEAEVLLDSLSKAYPKHPLDDDILMLQAKLAEKHREYNKALDYLKTIYEKYGKDVLGDDAVFKTAEIYEKYLHDNSQAKHFYEQLIIDYPGSTFVQTARNRLEDLNKAILP